MSNTSASFAFLVAGTATIRRKQDMVGGKRGTAGTSAVFDVLPLMPVDSDTRVQLGLDSGMMFLQTFIQGNPDVIKGDILVRSGRIYPIRYVGKWPINGDLRLHLIIEEINAQ